MVYDNSQSSLYRAVRRYNGERTENPACDMPSDKNCADDNRHCGQREHREPREHREHFERKERKEHCDSPKRGFPDNIFSDRDMMLIAGLIFVLLSEKADNKLILALALVLLG